MKDRTTALGIPRRVKEAVAARDSVEGWPCCILCGLPSPTRSPLAFSCAHYISRAQGGLGIEQNGLTLCPICHRHYDQTTARKEMRAYFREYLKQHYEEWSEEALVYRKGE